MPARPELPTRDFHLRLFAEDLEFLEDRLAGSQMGLGEALREIIHKRVLQLRAEFLRREDARSG